MHYIHKTTRVYHYAGYDSVHLKPETISQHEKFSDAVDTLIQLKKTSPDHIFYFSTRPTNAWRDNQKNKELIQ